MPGGKVMLSWETGAIGSEEPFRLHWIERDGPSASPPARRGFGSRLIERVLPADFKGEVSLSFDPIGLRYELKSSMRNLGSEAEG